MRAGVSARFVLFNSFMSIWPAPGSEDTELGVLMELEVGHGETEVTREFKLEAVRLIKDRGVSYVQASPSKHVRGLDSTTSLAPSKRREVEDAVPEHKSLALRKKSTVGTSHRRN